MRWAAGYPAAFSAFPPAAGRFDDVEAGVVGVVGVVIRTEGVVVARTEVDGVVFGRVEVGVDVGIDVRVDGEEDAADVGDDMARALDDGDQAEVRQVPRCLFANHAGAPSAIASSGQVIVYIETPSALFHRPPRNVTQYGSPEISLPMTAQPPPQSMMRDPLPGYPRSALITPASHTATGAATTVVPGAAVVVVLEGLVEVRAVVELVGLATTSGGGLLCARTRATVVTTTTRTATATTTATAR